MSKAKGQFLALSFCCLFSSFVGAEAPIIDDSENFAILDDQQTAIERPVAKAQLEENYPDEEIALAQDNEFNINNGDNASLLNKFKAMQQELQELRGQLEVQSHELKQLQQQQLTFYKDIDNRLLSPANKATPTAQVNDLNNSQQLAKAINNPPSIQTSLTKTTPIHMNPADEQVRYLAAYDLVKDKHFDAALTAMQDFITNYPHGGYSANAHYWLGELYLVKKNYSQAISHFETVLHQFPTSSKAAASSLKIGYALASSGKEVEAKRRLEQVLKTYPDTPTAELAATKLRSINAL